MAGTPFDGNTCSQAALHALGCLDSGAARDYEIHLAGCPSCREESRELARVAADLALLAPAQAPPPRLRERLLASLRQPAAAAAAVPAEAETVQTWKAWQATAAAAGSIVSAAAAGRFEPTGIAGIEVRRLFVDPAADRVTMLVRMAPGTAYPAHRHGGPEECYVVAGDLTVGADLHMRAGDYQRVERGYEHPVQSTENGCLLFIVSSLRDELLDAPGLAGA